jgi:xanthine dehydrogenase accessory factor
MIAAWFAGDAALDLLIDGKGRIDAHWGTQRISVTLPAEVPPWSASHSAWKLRFEPLPRVIVFGAGPETPWLLPALQSLSWRTVLVEQRERWIGLSSLADDALALSSDQAVMHALCRDASAALVMHHHFERDRETLLALAHTPIAYIGLLGPPRRRDDLFRVLPQAARDSLQSRLRAPVGLDLGGHGAEAIGLSIVAQLQRYRHGESPA